MAAPDVEHRIRRSKSRGLHRAGQNNAFSRDSTQGASRFYHGIGSVSDHHAGTGLGLNPLTNQFAIGVGHIQAVFAQNGFNLVLKGHIGFVDYLQHLRGAHLKLTLRIKIYLCRSSPPVVKNLIRM